TRSTRDWSSDVCSSDLVRSGKWKLHFPHEYRTLKSGGGKDGKPSAYATARIGLALYDLDKDIGETANVADKHPDVVQRLEKLARSEERRVGKSGQRGVQ